MMNIEEFLSGRSILIGKRLFVSIFILARRLEKEGIRNDVKKDEVQSKKSPSFKRASGFWLPVCNPLHNRSPAVNRKPSISTGYQRACCPRRAGSGVDFDFPITLPNADVASRVESLSQVLAAIQIRQAIRHQPFSGYGSLP